jgi:hypothetical protein
MPNRPPAARVPSRRSLLAASTATVTALAGCAAFADTEGSPANVQEHRDLQPDEGSVVARTATERTGCPRGDTELRAVAYELSDGDLQVVTTVEVHAGARRCDSDWRHDATDTTHDWSAVASEEESFVTGTETNVVYADTSDPEVRLRNTSNTEVGEWGVRRASDDGGVPETYTFRSTYAGADVGAGDDLATVTAAVPLSTGGPFGGESETVTLSETLVYGEGVES